MNDQQDLSVFLSGKSEYTLELFRHFVKEFQKAGNVSLYPAKTMIGIAGSHKRVAWITALGKNYINVVFPFKKPYADNLCFHKIAQVPGEACQFNHHFRMLQKQDVNEEVLEFMKLAIRDEQPE
jgi:hypothetical protein